MDLQVRVAVAGMGRNLLVIATTKMEVWSAVYRISARTTHMEHGMIKDPPQITFVNGRLLGIFVIRRAAFE